MPNYTFKPVLSVVKDDWVNNTTMEFPVSDEQVESARLIIKADSEDDARSARMPITNILAWELEETTED